ncbi:MAG: PQQ-dependent sugar dehydrogenase, partial [Gemmatimonadetes bacterium]|nr:PQQ-dependent sugar dehydrogenase [Gemmatimonadota bacterium]
DGFTIRRFASFGIVAWSTNDRFTLSNLVIRDNGGTGIRLHNGYLYHAQDFALVRYPMTDGELTPSGPAERLVTFPEQMGHTAKGLAINPATSQLYVNVGAPSNACQAKDRTAGSPGQRPCPWLELHGSVWQFEDDTPGLALTDGRKYATGMRQNYAMTWHDGALYLVQHGRDQMNTLFPENYDAAQNAELPSEEFLRVTEGVDFGWPYCYHDWQKGMRVQMPEYGGDGEAVGDCDRYPAPVAGFPGHWAPGSVHFYQGEQFPARYRGGAFIAFQGSWNRAPEPAGGYKVVFQPMAGSQASGNYEVFADGFAGAEMSAIQSPQAAAHRPNGVTEAPDGSLYISDQVAGTIWRVMYEGESGAD